jgi:uncharacterized peroxidase-related enzyme
VTPYIDLPEGLAGIRGLLAYSPETATPLNDLAQVLLCTDDTLRAADRELVATFVSARNECHFCQSVHGAVAAERLGGDSALVDAVKRDYRTAAISPRLKALLAIAAKVADDAGSVSSEDVESARREGATDKDIHDTVLIAAAFCMYNRYVDGLATWAPADASAYAEAGPRIVREGYATAAAGD